MLTVNATATINTAIISEDPSLNSRAISAEATINPAVVDIDGEVSDSAITADGRLSTVITHRSSDYDYYAGPYTVTPTTSEQRLSTANKITTADIIINPIPSNYGLITWNGATLTVS